MNDAGPPPAERARRIQAMFSSIAGAYDLLNRTLSLRQDVRWRRKAVAALPRRARATALDLCGGTGDLALEALRQDAAARVVLADFAQPMVERAARKRAARLGADQARLGLLVGDGLALPFADASFDLAMCAFGVRNLVDHERALRELHRVIKPGGELLVLEFMAGERSLFYALFLAYFRYVLPLVGRLVSGHPTAYSYLPASVGRFMSTAEWLALLQHRGFAPAPPQKLAFGIATITLARRR